MTTPNVSLTHVQHLALYTTFHRSHVNRLMQLVTLPGVFFTAMVLFAAVPFVDAPMAHLGTVLMVILFLTLARLHLGASLVMLIIGLLACAAAERLTQLVPLPVLVPVAAVLHLAAWFLSVKICHQRIEPMVRTPRGWEDTNVYFRHGHHWGSNLGVTLRPIERFTQFCISALSSTWDFLELFGIENPDEAKIAALRDVLTERLARGEPYFAAVGSSVWCAGVDASGGGGLSDVDGLRASSR